MHAIMGPNGRAKALWLGVIAGHPAFEVTEGEVLYQGQSVLGLNPTNAATCRDIFGLP
ncbi:MAG: hypothetical protein R2857_04640 [Vampirovibrionales bacterium]